MECTLSHKIDGLVLCATDWNVGNFTSNFQLKSTFTVKNLSPSNYKGLKFESNDQRIVRVSIGVANNFQFAFVLNICEGVSNDELQSISPLIQRMALKAVNSMLSSSTNKDWKSRSSNSEKTRIFLDDIVEFGNRLRRLVLSYFNRTFNSSYCKIVVSELGQDCQFENLDNLLNLFNLEFAEQVVVHYAIDYSLENCILFYNRENTVRSLGRSNLCQEYYVALISGNGNFYFKSSEKLTDYMCVEEVKFYSEVFKEYHRGERVRFSKPEIAEMIFDPRSFSKGFCAQYKYNWEPRADSIKTLKSVVDSIGTSVKQFAARYELIISISGDEIREQALEIASLISQHQRLNPRAISSLLRWMPIEEFSNHIQKNLKPFVDTLEHFVGRQLLYSRSGVFKSFTPEDYLSCLASEAVVCFALYGNALYRGGSYLYPAWVIKTLALQRSRFSQNTVSDAWAFPAVSPGPVVKFQPINFKIAALLKPIARKCRIAAEVVDPIYELEEYLYFHFNDADFSERLTSYIQAVSGVLLNLIVDSAFFQRCVSIPRNHAQFAMRKKLQMLRQPHILCARKHLSSGEFVQYVFERRVGFLQFVYWILDIVKFILESENVEFDLQASLRDQMEEMLFNENTFLYVTDKDSKSTFVVIPFAGTEVISFGNMNATRKCQLVNAYRQEFLLTNSNRNIEAVLNRTWNANDPFEKVVESL